MVFGLVRTLVVGWLIECQINKFPKNQWLSINGKDKSFRLKIGIRVVTRHTIDGNPTITNQ
jgi:hypothetical protein